MAKNKAFDVEAGIETILERGDTLKTSVSGHVDIIDDIANDLIGYSDKSHKDFSNDDKRVLYRRTEEAMRALLHAKGDTREDKAQYWKDLADFKAHYVERLNYVDGLMTLLGAVDRKYFDIDKRNRTKDVWEQAKKEATRALNLPEPTEAQLKQMSYPRAIEDSFNALRKICRHFYDLYDRKINPNTPNA